MVDHLFDNGPVNWARARLLELPTPDAEGHTHRVTLAFDTQLLPTREGRPYLAPSPQDMQSGEEFALSDAEDDTTGWFLEQDWVREWLHQHFHAYERRRRAPRRVDEAELRTSPDAQAAWLTVLTLLQRAVQPPHGCASPLSTAARPPGSISQWTSIWCWISAIPAPAAC
jgi:hypothetical protein